MLSDEGYEQLSYLMDQMDNTLYHLSNNIDESRLSKEDEERLTNDLDKVISQLINLKQQLIIIK
jgi:succinate dehydrogenase flavin-adding protein (antitoxin of CptAB toxin-antitoxin module)